MAFLSDPDSFSSFLRQLSAADRDEARQGFERTWRQATIERADDVLQALGLGLLGERRAPAPQEWAPQQAAQP